MFDKQNLANFDALKAHVVSLFPHHPLVLSVPEGEQRREIDLLKETLGSQRFFFVVDLPTFSLTQAHGLQRWLGYPNKQFSLKEYWSIVHPAKQKPLMAMALQLYDTLCTGKYGLKFMVQRYSSLVELKHYNGHYLSVKKAASVFQYDAANRLTAYLNEFTIIGSNTGQPLDPDFFTRYGDPELIRGGEIKQGLMERFLSMKVFSPREFQTARKLAYKPDITQAEIAHELGVAPYTVETNCRRFLRKARDFFQQDFSSAREAAIFLHKHGLL